jgi:hypothetical protein
VVHQVKQCSSCQPPNKYGCYRARLEIREAYDEVYGLIVKAQPTYITGVNKASGAHDLEGLTIKEMAQKVHELGELWAGIQQHAEPLPDMPAPSELVLLFVGAP